MPQVEVNIQTDGDKNEQPDASSRGKYSDRYGEINLHKDASSGGNSSDRWGDKCTDRCLK